MIDELVKSLDLKPHPEGGYYRETYRSEAITQTQRGPRASATAIYYLLPRGAVSSFHRVLSDELWHLYDGGAVALHLIDASDQYTRVVLGRSYAAGERPQVVVKAGTLQAAEPLGDYALCGCMVSPGFDFADWQLPQLDELAVSHPRHRELLKRFAKR